MKNKDKDDRIENLLVLILLNSLGKGAKVGEKALQLNLAGFSNIEIANFLGTSSQVIANALSGQRKGSKKKKK